MSESTTNSATSQGMTSNPPDSLQPEYREPLTAADREKDQRALLERITLLEKRLISVGMMVLHLAERTLSKDAFAEFQGKASRRTPEPKLKLQR